MIDLYAVHFEAEEPSASAARKHLNNTVELIREWIETAYGRQFGNSVTLPEADFSLDLNRGRLISMTTEETATGSCRIAKLTFTYPDKTDGNLLWTARIHVTQFAELIDFSMRLGIDSSQFVLSPVALNVGRPQLVPKLLSLHRWSLGGTRLSNLFISVSTQDVESFVQDRLLSPQRRLPVIIVSKVAHDDKALADTKDIANHLAGIAEVYELADKWASFKLTSIIGQNQACYNGAVRIYWPKGAETVTGYNPVILPHDRGFATPNSIRKRLFDQLSQLSALRFIDGPITLDAIEALEAEKAERLQKEKDTARAAGDTDELIAIAEEEIRNLRTSNERYKKETEQLRREHSLLAADLRTTQDNLKAVWTTGNESVEEPPLGITESLPDSVLSAVQEASEMYTGTLVFHQKAFSSAEDSPFKSPEEVKYALLAMDEVCQLLRKSRSEHVPIGSLEEQFLERGFTYKAHESETSMRGKMGDERKLTYQGKKVPIEKHLALGKGGPDTCLRIYFYDDEQAGIFVIGHVGRHKTNTKT